MAITSSGIGSGLDIEGIVSQLVAAERQGPTRRFNIKEAGIQQDISGFGALKSALSNFQTKVQDLQNPADFLNFRTESSDSEIFSASADENANPGEFNIQVEQLAQASRVRTQEGFDPEAGLGTGSITLGLGSESFDVAIDENNNTLAGIRDAINNAENNPGVSASIINVDGGSRLVLSSEKSGAGNDITLTATDNDAGDGADLTRLNTLDTVQASQSASVFIDGLAVTSETNTIENVIEGVSIDLKEANPGVAETLTVSRNSNATVSRVESFVESYNKLVNTMDQLSAYDPETERAGPLQGDSILRSIETQLRQTVTSSVEGLDRSSLAEIGITTTREGTLELDTERLTEVLDDDYSSISQLFTSDNGLANRVDSLLEGYIGNNSIIDNRTDSLRNRIEGINDDRAQLDRRIEQVETRLRAEFGAMDALVANLQSTGNFLTSQLANIPVPGSNNS